VIIIVMGVSGSGKSTLGSALAQHLRWDFVEGDDYHPKHNIEKMRARHPLDDEDRRPWLARLRHLILSYAEQGLDFVLACSALKAEYRDLLSRNLADIRFVFLCGDPRLIPYRRIGDPEDIAHAVVWLASDASDYVTGQTLYVDGGMTLYPEFREGG